MINVDITVERSTHPDFELFASTMIAGRQWATRGDARHVSAWINDIALAAQAGRDRGVDITLTVDNQAGALLTVDVNNPDPAMAGV